VTSKRAPTGLLGLFNCLSVASCLRRQPSKKIVSECEVGGRNDRVGAEGTGVKGRGPNSSTRSVATGVLFLKSPLNVGATKPRTYS
jgi:hypothetical protein